MDVDAMRENAAQAIEDWTREYAHLQLIEREYQVTVRVLAVVIERLLVLTHGKSVSITDEALAAAPDLQAWRDDPAQAVVVTVTR